MKTSSHSRTDGLDAAMTAALEAAVRRAAQQAGPVIMAARLATAVHMGRAAESATAGTPDATMDATPAAPTPVGAAAFAHRPAGHAGADEKSETRSTKHETNPKRQNGEAPTFGTWPFGRLLFVCLSVVWDFVLRISHFCRGRSRLETQAVSADALTPMSGGRP